MKAVAGLAEIVLWTHDMDRALAFYRDLFGLEVISPPGFPKLFLSAGTGPGGVPEMVVLMPHPEPGGSFPSEKPRRVLHHMAFAVEPSQYDGLEERCREAGLAHVAIPMRRPYDPRAAWRLAQLIRRERIQIVHAHKGRARTLTLLAGLMGARPLLVLHADHLRGESVQPRPVVVETVE